MSKNNLLIRETCQSLGITVDSLKWKPIGKAMEMCGREGGWILNDFYPIGLSTEEAIKHLRECPYIYRETNVDSYYEEDTFYPDEADSTY